MIWQPDPEAPRAVGVFARVMGAPGDRNLINFSVNAGVTLKAPLPTRDDDTFGVGFGFAKVSSGAARSTTQPNSSAAASARCARPRPSSKSPTRSRRRRWWQLQPDFQYVFTPGGGIVNPNNPSQSVGNEAVFGLRSVVTF